MLCVSGAKAVINVFNREGVRTYALPTVKELVQHFITSEAIEGYWGSPEQLAALKETQALLTRTITVLEADALRDKHPEIPPPPEP